MNLNMIPLGPFQEAFRRQQKLGALSARELAERLGWMRNTAGKSTGDATKALRYLGLAPQRCGHSGKLTRRKRVSYENAVKLARALNLDPFECGI